MATKSTKTKSADATVEEAKAAPKAVSKAATKAVPAKETATAEAPKKANALSKPVTPSADLADIVGKEPMPRTQVVSKIWDYIRKHDLQDPKDKRVIVGDDKLKKIFGKDSATMFELNKLITPHLS